MPTTETRVKFFDIDKCGYYKRRSSHPDFCSIPELLEDLVRWVADKSIAETATYSPSEEQDEATLRTFCFDIQESNGSYLLTTWNETPTLGGGVASVDLQGDIGSATIETAEVSTGFVPGYPSYFWFPSDTEHLVTVQIGNRLNGKANLCLYLEEYLEKYSCHAVVGEVEDDEGWLVEKVIGYSESGEEADIGEKQVKPRFQASQLTTMGDLDFIRQYVGNIRKIIKKDRISLTVQEKLRWWQAVTRIFRNDNQSLDGDEQHKIRIELEFTPTLEELNAMIREWQDNRNTKSSDVGVLFSDEPGKTYWFSKAIASELFDFDLTFSRSPVADSERLLTQLESNRSNIFAIIGG